MMVQIGQSFDKRTVLLKSVVKDLIVVISCIVKQMQQIVQVLCTNHDRSCRKEYSSICLAHDDFSSFVGLSLAITHLMSFITKNKAEMEVVLRKEIYDILRHIILSLLSFISFVTVLLFLQAYLLIIDDCVNGNTMLLHVSEQFFLAIIYFELESKFECQFIFPFPLQRLRTYYKYMM